MFNVYPFRYIVGEFIALTKEKHKLVESNWQQSIFQYQVPRTKYQVILSSKQQAAAMDI